MNPETKDFEPEVEGTPEDWPRFKVGQKFYNYYVEFRIRKITKKDIILRPVRASCGP